MIFALVSIMENLRNQAFAIQFPVSHLRCLSGVSRVTGSLHYTDRREIKYDVSSYLIGEVFLRRISLRNSTRQQGVIEINRPAESSNERNAMDVSWHHVEESFIVTVNGYVVDDFISGVRIANSVSGVVTQLSEIVMVVTLSRDTE